MNEYTKLIKQIDFELGGIAYKCKELYLNNTNLYDSYVPKNMLGASNDFYNYVLANYRIFERNDHATLKGAWESYKTYCEEARVPYPFSQRVFKEELKNYFINFDEKTKDEDGKDVYNLYSGFKADIFNKQIISMTDKKFESHLITFENRNSIFDKECSNCLAQYATQKGTPRAKWTKITSKLSDIDTSELHYVKVPENHIVIDFDILDENGNKCLKKNIEAASKWPSTYAELSKSGGGIHLHYIYTGNVNKLSRIYDDHIEIKVFTGGCSLRRMLTKCNNLPIATISSGLPLKGEKEVIDFEGVVTNEKALRTLIKRNINKEYHPGTKPSIDFIYKILEDAYDSGAHYDVSDLYNLVIAFAANSTHQYDYCMKLCAQMKFKSDEPSTNIENNEAPLVFYDVEVFPNLFLVNWKIIGEGNEVIRMINPRSSDIENILKYRLIGFNCRRYDNHILYARLMGYTEEQLFHLSQRIIEGDKNAFFGEAYNISYTDVYDFCSEKQSLKKWEIELGIHHQELGLPWDRPVPEELWIKVAEYCDNDVLATEAVFNARQADFLARQVLADVAGMTVNDTTNTLTTRIVFGNNRKPQDHFNYRDMGEISNEDMVPKEFDNYTRFNKDGKPTFPGYEYEYGISRYRDEKIGEGGYVYAEPGIYGNVALLDIASMHPSSIIAENLFGDLYSNRFGDILNARLAIKHKDFDLARKMLGGALAKYLTNEEEATNLAQALKIAINSVYGLTSARFENPFKDPRNIDNIVAKRGALFMVNLKHEVQKRGFTVAHIKTDSIKIPDATPDIIKFVSDYGKMYGYTFEHEATYDRMCLVNDAVYIAKYKDAKWCDEYYGHIPEKNGKKSNGWTATGTQFQVPYVFKQLFSKEDIVFEDMCETKSVQAGTMYIDMNENLPSVSEFENLKMYRNRYPNWPLSNDKITKKVNNLLEHYKDLSDEELDSEISKGHNYIFVGRVGQFCPIKSNFGGGILYREKDGKYFAVTGTKGYRWLESEMVKSLGKENDIDRSYYNNLVNEAIEAISFYGDFEWFVSNDPYVGPPYDAQNRPIYLDFGRDGQTTCV